MDSGSDQSQLSEDQERLLTAALLENLKKTPEERLAAHAAALELFAELSEAGKKLRAKSK